MGGVNDYIDSLFTVFRSRVKRSGVPRFSEYFQNIFYVPYFQDSGFTSDGMLEETTSLYHPFWQAAIRNMHVDDIGGPFFNRKATLTTHDPPVKLRNGVDGPFDHQYNGQVYPTWEVARLARAIYAGRSTGIPHWDSDNSLSRADLRAEGLKLMLRAVPSSPAFKAATTLGEFLSERGFFSLPGKGFLDENPGGEWLNLQFGILPVFSDAKAYLEAHSQSAKIAAQYLRDANKVVRRAREFPETRETTNDVHGGSILITGSETERPVLAALAQLGELTTTTKTSRRIWFSGAFRYYIPPNAEEWYKRLMAHEAVYGTLPTPETLWELTPFSWLTDWFWNAQDSIRSMFLAGTDGSVLVRGYVMCKTVTRTEYTWTGPINSSGWETVQRTWVVEETILQRERTGFYGLDWSGLELTPKQLSILTALGLSKR